MFLQGNHIILDVPLLFPTRTAVRLFNSSLMFSCSHASLKRRFASSSFRIKTRCTQHSMLPWGAHADASPRFHFFFFHHSLASATCLPSHVSSQFLLVTFDVLALAREDAAAICCLAVVPKKVWMAFPRFRKKVLRSLLIPLTPSWKH